LYELAAEAAGGSKMFKDFGTKMISFLQGKSGESADAKLVQERLAKLKTAVEEAQSIKCPVYLGSSALTLLFQTEKEPGLASLLKLYT
jgi:3-hydroxyisobutyrate dehydrogenase